MSRPSKTSAARWNSRSIQVRISLQVSTRHRRPSTAFLQLRSRVCPCPSRSYVEPEQEMAALPSRASPLPAAADPPACPRVTGPDVAMRLPAPGLRSPQAMQLSTKPSLVREKIEESFRTVVPEARGLFFFCSLLISQGWNSV